MTEVGTGEVFAGVAGTVRVWGGVFFFVDGGFVVQHALAGE